MTVLKSLPYAEKVSIATYNKLSSVVLYMSIILLCNYSFGAKY